MKIHVIPDKTLEQVAGGLVREEVKKSAKKKASKRERKPKKHHGKGKGVGRGSTGSPQPVGKTTTPR